MIPNNRFTPNSANPTAQVSPQPAVPMQADKVSLFLLTVTRVAVVALAFLLPIFFLPGLWGTLSFQKSFLALAAIATVVVAGSLLALRTKEVKTVVPIPTLLFLGVTVLAIVSAVLSVDTLAALRGSTLEVQTVAFMLVLFGVMCLPLVLQESKRYMFFACAALGSGLALMLLYVATRLLLGPVASFGSFFSTTQSPVGNLNDVALLAGVVVIMSMVTLVQLQLRLVSQVLLATVIGLSLLVLTVVNFFYVWVVIGFLGLVVLLYLLSFPHLPKHTSQNKAEQPRIVVIALAGFICLMSSIFIVAGDYAGAWVSERLQVQFLEVRPSFSANADIARGVYSEQLLFGVGPNQYQSAWREHKDVTINETVFWNTDFVTGSGYIPTLFVTLGLLGGLLYVLFTLWYFWFGVRTLLRSTSTDSFWYYAGLLSFVGSVFLWGMSYVYVPSATVLLIAAFLTGLTFVARSGLLPESSVTIPLVTNHKRGFVVMALVIVSIMGSIFVLYTVGEQYVAQSSFNKTQQSAADLATIDQAAMRAYDLYPNHQFLGVRAQAALLEMNRLLGVNDPTEADQQRFVEVAEQALLFTNSAIAASPHNPEYRLLQAFIFNNYAIAGIEEANERTQSALTEAVNLDPKNPSYALAEAQMAFARGDVESVRTAIGKALALKNNFTQALSLLSELDIAEGNVPAAIETAITIITLEPQNPARYYQLGILYTADDQTDQALAAYQAALTLDPGFANARYLQALLLVDQGQIEAALVDLRLVAQTNADNDELASLIAALESGDVPSRQTTASDLDEELLRTDQGSNVAPDTNLVTPLNTVSNATTNVETSQPTGEAQVSNSESTAVSAVETDQQ